MDFENLTKKEWAKLADTYMSKFEETGEEKYYELNLYATFLSLDDDKEIKEEHLKNFKEIYGRI